MCTRDACISSYLELSCALDRAQRSKSSGSSTFGATFFVLVERGTLPEWHTLQRPKTKEWSESVRKA